MNSRSALPFLPCLTLVATLSSAQDTSAPEKTAGEEPPRFEDTTYVEGELPALPPPSTSATRVPVAVKDLPVTVSVVPGSLIDEQKGLVLGDALKNASGVNVGTGFGVFDFFVIRGFDSLSSGLVLTDGVPEPESTFYPLYNVRQVEVLKGPAAFLYGANPLAGAVQIVRKQPLAKPFAEASFTYGRFGTFEGALDGSAATDDGRLAFRLNGVWQGTDSHRDLAAGSIKALNPVLEWRPDRATRVALNYERARSEWPPDTGIPFVGDTGSTLAPVPRTRSYQSPLDSSVQDVHRVRVEAERRWGKHLTLRNRFYFTKLAWDSDGTLLAGTFPGPDGRSYVARTLVLLDDSQRLLGNQLELLSSFKTGPAAHELLVGLELSRFKDRFVQNVALLSPLDLLNPVEPAGGGGPPVTLPNFGLVGDSRSLVVAPYLVDRISFSRSVQAFVGGRLDRLDYEDQPSHTNRDDTKLSPLLGLVVSPTDRLSFHVSGGTSFAPPSTQVVGPREPEKGRQIEVGGKLQFLGGKGFLGGSVYDLTRKDIAIPDSSGLSRQVGDQRSRGFELDFTAEAAPGLVTYATYAFTDAELRRYAEGVLTPNGFFVFDRSGNTAAFAPRHLATLWVSKRWRNGLGIAAGARALSDQFVGEDNRYRIDGYATLDAAFSYETGRARFSLNLKNLTDTEYQTRGFGGASAIPARPFEALARVEVTLGSR